MANEDTTIQYGKWVIAGFIALIAVGVYFGFFNKAGGTKTKVDSGLSQQQASLTAAQYSAWDGTTVSGSDVIACIQTNASTTVSVVVKTKANATTGKTYTTSNGYIFGNSPTNIDYIEPSQWFKSVITTSTNGTVNTITLTQQ